jgi:P27 family predicted phage terminase small subunit
MAAADGSARGRKPRPANLRLVEGRAPGRDSGGRKVATPPAFNRVPPERPDHLSPIAAQLWDRIVLQLPSLGLLKELDGPSLEMLCETYARWREAVALRHRVAEASPGTGGLLGKNSQGTVVAPYISVEVQASKEFRGWCSEYGLTPSAEMRLATPGADPDDPQAGNPFASNGTK